MARRAAGAWLAMAMLTAPGASRAAPPAPAGGHAPVRFQIRDQLDEREVDEFTTIYVNGTVVGAFHLDGKSPDIVLDVTVPGAEHYEVALCGSITIHGRDGEPETHRVNSVGEVDDVEGRVFEALGAADFTEFYLVDRTLARQPTQPRRGEGGVCTPATS